MKKLTQIIVLLLTVVTVPSASKATIVDLPDVASLGYFSDTSTGYTWMDVDDFFGMNFYQIQAAIAGTGYEIATLSDIQTLHASLPHADYFTWNTIIGYSVRPNTDLTWGFYDIGGLTTAGGAWMYSDIGSNGNGTQWNYSTVGVPGYFGPYNESKSTSVNDLGAWVVNKNQVVGNDLPEPSSVLLIALGAAGLVVRKRRALSRS